jgi:phosphate transport system substrate-binding protein
LKTQRFLSTAVCATLALGLAACGGDDDETSTTSAGSGTTAEKKLSGSIAGAGASSQDAAKRAWIAGFQTANPDASVSYEPVGSGGGREQFIAGGTAFGGTDSAFDDDELKKAQERCGGPDNLIQMPIYISPIAIIYNLEGVENLQLSPATLAKVLKQDIKKWNDPAIAADNPDAQLPDENITVVNRSDESGTTENLQEYLSEVAKEDWDFEVSGDWPVKGGEAAQGTSGVVDAVTNGAGTIGYADASQAGELGVAKIKVGEQFSEPTPEAASAVVEASEQNTDAGKYGFTYDLARDTTEAGAYPIVLVSYEMACTQYDKPEDAELVKGFLNYELSEEGQKAAAEAAGSAPLSSSLREKFQPAVDAIGSGAAS